MINILQVIGKLNVGGAENVLMSWFRNIDSNKFHFDFVVYGNEKQDYEEEVLNKGSKVFHVHSPGSHCFKFNKELHDILNNNNYDIIHAHTLLSNGIVLKCAKNFGDICTISHSHSTQNRVNENVITKIYAKVMRKLIIKNADYLLACGKAAGNFLYGENNFKENGYIVENAIDAVKFRYDENIREEYRKKLNYQNEIVIGNVSRFHEVKNHKFMIEMFKKLHSVNRNYRLLLVGDGSERDDIEKMISEYQLGNVVKITGMVNDAWNYYNVFDMLIMPSFHEGFPLSILEAQANGLEIILSDTITKEVCLSNNVHYLSIDDKEKWIDLILKYENNVRNNNVINTKYDLNCLIRKLENIYINCRK